MAISAGLIRGASRLSTGGAAAMRVGEVSCGFKSAFSLVSCSGLESISARHYKSYFTTLARQCASAQRMGLDPDDFDLGQLADQRRRPFGEHRLHIGRAAERSDPCAAGLLEQNLEAPSDGRAVEGLPLALDERLKLSEPPAFVASSIWSGISAAGVPGRGEYLNEKARRSRRRKRARASRQNRRRSRRDSRR